MYVFTQTDDGGVASRGLALPDDTTAVSAHSGVRGRSAGRGRPTDDNTIRKGSEMSVPGDSGSGTTNTRVSRTVQALSVDIHREIVNDPRLSFRAVGLYVLMQTLPDGASRSAAELAKHTPEGREAVASALRELVDAGYCEAPRNANRCPVCAGILGPPKGVTYVARRQDWVKIGRTAGPVHRRIKALTRRAPGILCPEGMDLGSPVALLHVIARDVEHDLHERYAAHHVVGEWFHADPAMLAEIGQEAAA